MLTLDNTNQSSYKYYTSLRTNEKDYLKQTSRNNFKQKYNTLNYFYNPL